MIRIRLKRLGRKKSPFYRIVAVDIRSKRDGATLAQLGFYNPISRELKFNKPEADEWIKKGAQLSDPMVRLYKLASDSGDVIVLERVRQEKLSKKAKTKLEDDAKAAEDAKAKAAEEAKAAAEAAAQPKEEPVVAEEVAAAVEEAPVPVAELPVEAAPDEVASEAAAE